MFPSDRQEINTGWRGPKLSIVRAWLQRPHFLHLGPTSKMILLLPWHHGKQPSMQHVTFYGYLNSKLQQLPATHHWLSSLCGPVLMLNPSSQLPFLTECVAFEAVSSSIPTVREANLETSNCKWKKEDLFISGRAPFTQSSPRLWFKPYFILAYFHVCIITMCLNIPYTYAKFLILNFGISCHSPLSWNNLLPASSPLDNPI